MDSEECEVGKERGIQGRALYARRNVLCCIKVWCVENRMCSEERFVVADEKVLKLEKREGGEDMEEGAKRSGSLVRGSSTLGGRVVIVGGHAIVEHARELSDEPRLFVCLRDAQ